MVIIHDISLCYIASVGLLSDLIPNYKLLSFVYVTLQQTHAIFNFVRNVFNHNYRLKRSKRLKHLGPFTAQEKLQGIDVNLRSYDPDKWTSGNTM